MKTCFQSRSCGLAEGESNPSVPANILTEYCINIIVHLQYRIYMASHEINVTRYNQPNPHALRSTPRTLVGRGIIEITPPVRLGQGFFEAVKGDFPNGNVELQEVISNEDVTTLISEVRLPAEYLVEHESRGTLEQYGRTIINMVRAKTAKVIDTPHEVLELLHESPVKAIGEDL
jgi:hypothetical protein